MKRVSPGPARRYARVLLDLARQKGDPAALRRELQDAVRVLEEHQDLALVLTHPALNPARKKKVVATLFRGKASDLLVRLLELLAERDRIGLLPHIEHAFSEAWNAERGVVAVEAVVNTALDPAEHEALKNALGKATGREIELETGVDTAVLGGVLLRLGGFTYDGTVRTRIRALRERLIHGSERR